jgi:hypothetical protein
VLIAALSITAVRGTSALSRQRARVLLAGFTVGQLAPVMGTTLEAVTGMTVPYLNVLWKLNLLFPVAVAYAMMRYELFDVRAVVRVGSIYAIVTGVVILAYAGAITALNVVFTRLGMGTSPLATAVVLALAVVLFLNPVYARAQRVVDRLFFRQRLDVQRSIERLSGTMTTVLDLDRIAGLIGRTVDESFFPSRLTLAVLEEDQERYRVLLGSAGPMGASGIISANSSLPRHLVEHRQPVTRVQHEADPDLASCRDACLTQMRALGAELVVPLLFGDRATGLLALGESARARRIPEDLRLLRVVSQPERGRSRTPGVYSWREPIDGSPILFGAWRSSRPSGRACRSSCRAESRSSSRKRRRRPSSPSARWTCPCSSWTWPATPACRSATIPTGSTS